MSARAVAVDVGGSRITLLDVGEQKYGDSVLCEIAGLRILIDGAHKGANRQAAAISSRLSRAKLT